MGKNRMKRNWPGPWTAVWLGIFAVFLALSTFGFWRAVADEKREDEPLLQVNGMEVSVEEFRAAMELERVGVIHHFQTKHGADYTEDFWEKWFDGESPAGMLRMRAQNRCVARKIQQAAAVGAGILRMDDTSYEAFLKQWQEENERRKKALAQGKIIYGPQTYGKEEYDQYVMNNMEILLKKQLTEGKLRITGRELADFYMEHQASLYRKAPRIRTKKLFVPASIGEAEVSLKQAQKARSAAVRLKSLDRAASSAGLMRPSEQLFDDSTLRGDERYAPDLLEAAKQLSPGQISDVIAVEDGFVILQGVERGKDGYYPIDDVREDIIQRLTDKKYKAWLSGEISKADVMINKEAYGKVMEE